MRRLHKKTNHHPLMSWDIIMLQRSYREDLRSDLFRFHSKYNWTIDLSSLLRSDFDAIVLTNLHQDILWVSKGFEQMTGYSVNEAIGMKPTFLQGKATSKKTRRQIRQQLSVYAPVSGSLVNYKKNGLPYLCSIHIFPIFNQQKEPVNFIAFEKELLDIPHG